MCVCVCIKIYIEFGTMTTLKKDEKRTSKKSKSNGQKTSSRKTAKQVPSKSNGTKVRTGSGVLNEFHL